MTSVAVDDEPDLDKVAAAALGCPLVANLTGGRFVEAATYLPGRRLVGVRAGDDGIEVHVVARWGKPLPEVADAVRRAVSPHAAGRPVAVFIDDIEVPDQAKAEVGTP
jgi:uncharacterized alkaline shock family protein YloU